MSTIIQNIISAIIGGFLGAYFTNKYNKKHTEQELIAKIIRNFSKCYKITKNAMQHPEANLSKKIHNPYSANAFLENRCEELINEQEQLKSEFCKVPKNIQEKLLEFINTFNEIAKYNMANLTSYEIYTNEIKLRYNNLLTILKELKEEYNYV